MRLRGVTGAAESWPFVTCYLPDGAAARVCFTESRPFVKYSAGEADRPIRCGLSSAGSSDANRRSGPLPTWQHRETKGPRPTVWPRAR
jgi:hypothetical protein